MMLSRIQKRLVVLLLSLQMIGNFAIASVTPNKYECVYSYFSPVTILDVITDKRETRITFEWNTSQNGGRLDIDKTLYLTDSKGQRHNCLSTDNIKIGRNMAEEGSERRFSISFEPLPSGERIFDIVSGCNFTHYFRFYGVHQAHDSALPYKSYVPEKNSDNLAWESHSGNAVIRGRVVGDIGAKSSTVTCSNGSNMNGRNLYDEIRTKIDAHGEFSIELEEIGKRWMYLVIGESEIPVYVNAGDTLDCIIKNLGAYNQECLTHSTQGNALHENLLRADPDGPYCEWLRNKSREQPISQTLQQLDEEHKRIHELYKYLAWKYKLDDYEMHLMMLNMQQRLEIIRMQAISSAQGVDLEYNEMHDIFSDPHWIVCPEAPSLQLNQDRMKK